MLKCLVKIFKPSHKRKKATARTVTMREYDELFSNNSRDQRSEALKHALDIRKFEIDLYWKRATYYWAFMVSIFVGYTTVYAKDSTSHNQDLMVAFSCLGVIFSFSWFLANKGSKQWQENWENHVDMLEDKVIGPLYKIVMKRPEPRTCSQCLSNLFLGPGEYSVSKINQLISIVVFLFWCFLLLKSSGVVDFYFENFIVKWPFIFVALGFCILLLTCCKTHIGNQHHLALRRRSRIIQTKSDE